MIEVPETDLMQALHQEERLRRVEERVSTHEAVCETRYNTILASSAQTQTSISSLHSTVRDQVRYMLWALIAMAMASAFGKDLVAALAAKYLGI